MKTRTKHSKTKRFLALAVSVAMMMSSLTSLAASADKSREMAQKESAVSKQTRSALPESYVTKEGVGRTQVNFNRNWKFIRSDVTGAEDTEYDDSTWVDVAIPHNFSIPYEMTAQFYVGYGWYRKEFDMPADWKDKKVELEFEGVFQEADIFVNGQAVGTHRGGYSGFVYDITDYLQEGTNLVAVRVNNIWQHDLAPRGGDHQFTGGIYRDVYLNVTEDVHVTWYGTFVTTPDLTNPDFDSSAENIDFSQYPTEDEIRKNIAEKRSNVRVQTEVKNDSDSEKEVQVVQRVEDSEGQTVTEFASEKRTLKAGELSNFDAVSEQVENIHLWSVEDPYLYTVYTTVISDGICVDTYESPLGFRWAQYKKDGFYLNGEKTLLDGANAHQDHAGFADAVTDEGFYRDVSMIKECGMNFIRGSHYPHDPSYAEACDELGILFWCECNFWGMGGCAGKDGDPVMSAADWHKDAYPQNPEDEAAFEQSCMDSLEAMIRVNRNHPSIINWSMGNEVFFTSSSTQAKAKALVNKMRNRAHELDPTRKAGMGGCQREGYDSLEICDIAGYNGDGGKFQNDTMPNVVAEYGSRVQDRPGEFRPYYDQIQGSSITEYVLKKNSAGMSLWCAFHHGTIGGDGLAKMGMIDYYRLPLNTWYWYREKNTGAAREASVSGEAVSMEITASDAVITNDGKKDTRLIVTMKDANGRWVSDTRTVTLTVEEGPGILPGGKSYTFVPDKSMRDGKASIEFRSYYEGTSVITAHAEGLPDASITIYTENVTGMEDGEEPENFYDASMWGTVTEKVEEPFAYGGANAATGRPVFPSSNKQEGELATDGDAATSWTAEKTGNGEYFILDLEFALYVYKIGLDFERTPYPYKIETAMEKDGEWVAVADYTKDTLGERLREETVDGREARYVRVTFTDVPDDEKAFLSEIEVYGNVSSQAPQYASESVWLSEVVDYDSIVTGWKTPGKNTSCEGAPIRVGGTSYEKGIGVHADSTILYQTEGKYSRISGVAGIDNEVSGGNAIFRIYADNKLIYERELSGSQADRFDLSISGAETLRLVTDANGGDSEDHTDWADVKLYGALRDVSRQGGQALITAVGMTPGLCAAEDYCVSVSVKNEADRTRKLSVGALLYDRDGALVDVSVKKITPGAGKTMQTETVLAMPQDISGYHMKLLVWDSETLEPVSKPVCVYPDRDYLTGGKKEVTWTKFDGEEDEIEKTGSWKLWSSDAAYQGTETYSTDASGNTFAVLVFTGNYVRIGAKIDGSQVGADVYLDDVKAGTINTKAADNNINIYQQVWASDRLENGRHTVKLVPTGKFGLDYIETGAEKEVEHLPENEKLVSLKAQTAELMEALLDGTICNYTEASRSVLAEALSQALELCAGNAEDEALYDNAGKALQDAVGALEENAKQDPEENPKDNPEETPNTETPGTENPQPVKPNPVPAKGAVYRSADGVLQYTVTKSAAKNGTVSVTKLLKKSKTKVTIPSVTKIGGYTFRVTSIGAKAFQNCGRLKTVVIGANVTSIGKNSFYRCKKLGNLAFKGTKAPKIGTKAFQGIKAKAKISIPKKMSKKQLATLKKRMKRAGAGKQIIYKQK